MKAPQKPFLLVAVFVLIILTGCTYNTTVRDEKDSGKKQETANNGKQNETGTGADKDTKPSDTVSEAWLLVPGQSAGLTKLNENADKVYQKLGPPDGGDAAMQKAVAIWYTNYDSTNHSLAIYTARDAGDDPVARIKQIRITSPTFKTADGIGPSSSLSQIVNAFEAKQTEQYSDEGTNYKVYDSPKGIAFEVGPGNNCVSVVIHEAGVTGQGTYLKFRTTNKFISRKKA